MNQQTYMWQTSDLRARDSILRAIAWIRDKKELKVEIGVGISNSIIALRGEPSDVETLMVAFEGMMETVHLSEGGDA